MSFTYSGNPAASALDEVRFLIADTDSTKPWALLDAEINYAIGLYSDSPPVIGNNFLAAAVCAETILGKFKGVAQSKSVGDLRIDYGQQFKFYQSLAQNLRNRGTLKAVPVYVGGMSRSEKQGFLSDPDRVECAAQVDGMNRLNEANDPLTHP